MSSNMAVLRPFQLFTAETIDTNLTSPITTLFGVKEVFIAIDWTTATAVSGAITVEVLYDNADHWKPLEFASAITISGSGYHEVLLEQVPFGQIRLKYTSTSGTGVLNAWIQGKGC